MELNEIDIQHRNSAKQFVYFIIGLNAACIGFIITQTGEIIYDHSIWFVVGALILFGLSTWQGIKNILTNLNNLRLSYNVISIKKGYKIADEVKVEGVTPAQLLSVLTETAKKHSNTTAKTFYWMLNFFYLGIFSYLIWHVFQIVQQSVCLF